MVALEVILGRIAIACGFNAAVGAYGISFWLLNDSDNIGANSQTTAWFFDDQLIIAVLPLEQIHQISRRLCSNCF
jgi:hypothetical protein